MAQRNKAEEEGIYMKLYLLLIDSVLSKTHIGSPASERHWEYRFVKGVLGTLVIS